MGVESEHGGRKQPTRSETDRAADFGTQFRAVFRTLWLVAVSIVRDRSLADDVVQDAAIIAYRKFDEFQPGSNFAAWMSQTVRYVALNESRRGRRRATTSLEMGDAPGANEGELSHLAFASAKTATEVPDRETAFGEHGGPLQQAMNLLSPVARACLLLRTVDGLEYSSISELLGIPEGTAMSHVHRARKMLRDQLAAEPDLHLGKERG